MKDSSSQDKNEAWWGDLFHLRRPTLFSTWDGVFTSSTLNIFGVVIFVRTGWIVGNSGLMLAIVIMLITMSISVISVLSAIGICQKGNVVCNGGVYTLIAHVLGGRIATPFVILYVLSQGIACSLCVLVFGHSIVQVCGCDGCEWVGKAVACITLVFILGSTVLGVTWVVGLHIVLTIIFFVTIANFILGSLITVDKEHGILGYSKELFKSNYWPSFAGGEDLFSVLGVYVPMSAGVFAGFNMSLDLKNPKKNIPIGTMASIAFSATVYALFALILACTCDRNALIHDKKIAEKVSASRILWLFGLYEVSLASAVGNLLGCPVALQGIAVDRIFSFIKPLALGSGPNKAPLAATGVLTVVCMMFVLMGQLNSLSRLTTVLFLLTYSLVNYSYFILSMSQEQGACDKNGFRVKDGDKDGDNDGLKGGDKVLVNVQKDGCAINNNDNLIRNEILRVKQDYEKLEKLEDKEIENGIKSDKNYLEKETLIKNGLNRNQKTGFLKHNTTYGSVDENVPIYHSQDNVDHQDHQHNEIHENNEKNSKINKNIFKFLSFPQFRRRRSNELQESCCEADRIEEHPPNHHSHPHQIYSLFNLRRYPSDLQVNEGDWWGYIFCNCWTSLVCAVSCFIAIVCIDWIFTILCLIFVLIMWLLIGIHNPGVSPGIAKFSYKRWCEEKFSFFSMKRDRLSQLVIFRSSPYIPVKILHQTKQQNDLREVFSQLHGIKYTKQLNLYTKHYGDYHSLRHDF